ncbi:uncharacterized protein BT62DRAFT_1003823 [Guyanagaster necrorhizus]|uniref:Uncharacterized protein n=1 Tax=Guyanagaster necrorhizus TaxID=856835 RepID=A0A9P7VVC9_9AGAR|nr:uncharacterized protein BT62DRAFT_1003823 [Guyanagaster necrorhizus MCA 3950]KAG7448048.1 hypothetical protein BT62DRAFT_1003823 [Guyanagaster necrorhizus MCA 3950]
MVAIANGDEGKGDRVGNPEKRRRLYTEEKTKIRVKQRDVTSFLGINSGRVTAVTDPKEANRRRDPSRSGEQIGHCACKRATRTGHANIWKHQLHQLRKKCTSPLHAYSTQISLTAIHVCVSPPRTWSLRTTFIFTGQRVSPVNLNFKPFFHDLLMPLSIISAYLCRIPTIYRVCIL